MLYRETKTHQLPMVLYPKRGKSIAPLVGALILTAGGFWLVNSSTGSDRILGYLTAGFFGLSSAVILIMFIPGNSFLRLDEEGFTYHLLFRERSRKWKEIESFAAVDLGVTRGKATVGWTLLPENKIPKTNVRLNRVLIGCDEALPHTYGGKSAADLAQLMNECWRDAQ